MANLPNLGAHTDGAHITKAQSLKEVTSNALDDLLDNSNNNTTNVTVSVGSPVGAVVTVDNFTGNARLKLVPEAGSPGGPETTFTLEVPATNRLFVVSNTTGQTATVDVSGGASTTVDVEDGEAALIHGDGTGFEKIGSSQRVYDIGFFASGIPTFDAVAGLFVAVRPFTVPAGAPGSRAYADTPPASGETDKVFDIFKNGASVGSVTFAALSNTGTFSLASDAVFAAGDRLLVVNPANPSPSEEATDIANISIVFKVVI